MATPSSSVFSAEQQAAILDGIVGSGGFSRLYLSILVSRAGAPPSMRTDPALDKAATTVINWLMQHHAAVAVFDLMLQEKLLINVNQDGDVSFLPAEMDDKASSEELHQRLTDLIAKEIVAQTRERRSQYGSIPPTVFGETRRGISALDTGIEG